MRGATGIRGTPRRSTVSVASAAPGGTMGRMRRKNDSLGRYRDGFMERDRVQELDDLTMRAWPALTVLNLDGWRLRTARGFTRRANSVWPRGSGQRLRLEAKIANVERHYHRRGLPARFQLSPAAAPAGLARALSWRGYAPSPPEEVRTGRVEQLAAAGSLAGVVLADEPTDRWLAAWRQAGARAEPDGDIAEAVLRRVPAPSLFALLHAGGQDIAVARGVVDGGWLGVADLATARPHRRRGAARLLLAALAGWAAARGAEQAWATVESGNVAAVSLWRQVGLRPAYTYRYRERQPAAARAR